MTSTIETGTVLLVVFPAHSLVSERAESDIRRRGIGGAIYPVADVIQRQSRG